MTEASRARGHFIEVAQNGRIVSTWETSEEAAAGGINAGQLPQGHYLVALKGDPATQWYDGDRVVDRPANPVCVLGGTLTQLPPDSHLYFRGDRIACGDASVTLPVDDVEENNRVIVYSFPELDKLVHLTKIVKTDS